jgi:hypothetical protein
VAIFARSLVPGDLIELPPQAGLPDLGEIDLVPLTNPLTHQARRSPHHRDPGQRPPRQTLSGLNYQVSGHHATALSRT